MAQKQTMESMLRTIRELSERKDDAAQTPDCGQCGFKMSLLATLAQISNRPTLNVFRCVPCSRIASTPRIWTDTLVRAKNELRHGAASRTCIVGQ
jgi:hypothetical protein